MGDLRPPLAPALNAFGVPATVTPKDGAPVVTTVIRTFGAAPPTLGEVGMSAASAAGLRDFVSIPRGAISERPEPGSTIEADFGEGLRSYRVNRVYAGFQDEWRVEIT